MKPSTPNIILDIQNLSCGYGGKPIVENFNLQVNTGDVVAITGTNGCGKSTLLKAIYQLCMINKGSIIYKGESLIGKTPEKIKNMGIAYFMQKSTIFSLLSVKENLILSLNGMSERQKNIKIDKVITDLPDIGKWLKKAAGLLSGGQRQQLALAMLLAQEADLWLLDEPTSGLDTKKTDFFVSKIQEYLQKNEENKRTVIFIEHKTEIINKLATQIIKFKNKHYENNY